MFVAVAVLLVLAAPAGAFIYWGNINQGTIGRAQNDGSSANPGFITGLGSVHSLAVDAGHVYWANEKAGTIGRANIDGTGVDTNFITGIEAPTGVAVTASSIYWSAGISSHAIGRAKIDGTSPQYAFIAAVDNPCGVAVDSGHVYWDEVQVGMPAYLGRAGLDGSNVEPTFIELPGFNIPCGAAVDSANIFWGDPLGGRIGRANKVTGTGADPNYIGEASGPCGIARDSSTHILWANHGTGTIGRANADGTGVDQSFIAAGSPEQICGIAVDDLSSPPPPPAVPPPTPSPAKPRASISSGPGKKLDQDIATFAFKADEKGTTFRCRLDSKKPVKCKSPKTYKHLKPGRHTFRVWAVDAAGDESTPAKRSFKVPRAGR